MEAQRLRCYWMGEKEVLNWLRWASGLPETIKVPEFAAQIPDGAEIVSIHYEWSRRAFGIILSHPSFKEVVNGYEIPWAQDPLLAGYRIVRIAEPTQTEQPAG